MTDDKALDTIREVIWAISQPVAQQQMPAVDPADVRSVLIDAGTGLYGSGEASGPPTQGRATRAAELAIAEIKRQLKTPKP
jgi:cell division GTPase FtsZ